MLLIVRMDASTDRERLTRGFGLLLHEFRADCAAVLGKAVTLAMGSASDSYCEQQEQTGMRKVILWC